VSAPRRLIVGMAGAPGATYTVSLLGRLRQLGVESHLVTCGCSRSIIYSETGLGLRQLCSRVDGWYHERNQAAAISSGSFLNLGMVIVPCTMRSLAAVVTGVADNLVQRAADVTLKEGRMLVLAMAESSSSPIGRENLRHAEEVGMRIVTLPPPGPALTVAEKNEEILACFGIGEAAMVPALQ
jgi:polyprenyl P-hydroxybenzoate/phenylacrylic acid decarboxylase-like protein